MNMAAKPKHDWYQSDTEVALTILKRGVPLDECRFSISDNNNLRVTQGEEVLFEGDLSNRVKTDDVTVKCTAAKVELRLPKLARGERWQSLLKDGQGSPQLTSFPTAPVAGSSTTTSTKKNWDAIEKQAIKDEEEEKLDGDAAVNKTFRDIYANASDDTKKAMMKSYSESGGTVLSTNWAEISKKKVEVQPPACMEYKKFEN